MPDTAVLVVPLGTVLPPDVLAKTVKGWAYETDDGNAVSDTAVYVFDNVERDIYLLNLDYDGTVEVDMNTRVGEGENLTPDAPWSATFHTYPGEDDVFATVHRGEETGQVIFCGDSEGDVRLQLTNSYAVHERTLKYIVDFGRLVRAINGMDEN
jgi:hypothetical protein